MNFSPSNTSNMYYHHIFLLLQLFVPPLINGIGEGPPPVSLKISDGANVDMHNGIVKAYIWKKANYTAIYYNDQNQVSKQELPNYEITWLENNRLVSFNPSNIEAISNTDEFAHVMYTDEAPNFLRIELHYAMQRGLNGIYSYIKVINNQNKSVAFTKFCSINRFAPQIFKSMTNGIKVAEVPKKEQLEKLDEIQDATWRLPNGTIYSTYDFAGYIRETSYQGLFGEDFGVWLISPSREYHSGGPLKQELLVGENALISNCLSGNEFETPVETLAPVGWKKIFGPWLLYFNDGNQKEVEADVKRQTELEMKKWPYKWMNDPDYPVERGMVSGRVTGPSNSMVVLHSSLNERFETQTLGYLFCSETGRDGQFLIQNVRPGKYKLTAYPLSGYGIGAETEHIITVGRGRNEIGVLNLDVPKRVKWSLGETNRRSDSYRYSNESRNYIWQTKTPANLTFEIGKSIEGRDWYYAQTKEGIWSIEYDDEPNGRDRIVRIGIAATTLEPTLSVIVNGEVLYTYQYGDDHAIYRGAMQSGKFYAETFRFPAKLVRNGVNLIEFKLWRGAVMYDSINMSDAH